MNKKIDKEFEDINDIYVLKCICTELKNMLNIEYKQRCKIKRFIIKIKNDIKENCIDDEFYINLSNKEKSIIDVLTMIDNEMYKL